MTNETLANGLSTVRSYQDTTGRLTAISSDLGGTGAYTYPPSGANSARPHAVTSVNGNIAGVVNPNYTYDANGNMITAFAGTRTITYASFNLPTQIARGGTAVSWVYDADHVRTKQSSNANMTGQAATVYYLNAGSQPLFEKHIGIVGTGLTEYRHFIGGVAVYTQNSNAIADTKYLLKDHLGSTTVMTNSAGVVLERYSYDPFGKTRNLNGSDIAYSATMPAPSVRRGFTDHEMLPEFAGGLIHMNGRIYDPNLGRFMTADSVIPDPDDSQSYNRYSYVFNNPLTMTDPDGHCPVCIVILAVAGGVAVSMTTTVVAAIAVGAVFGAMAAGVASEGDPRAMLQGAVIGGIMAGIGFQMTHGGEAGAAGASGGKSAVSDSYWNMTAQTDGGGGITWDYGGCAPSCVSTTVVIGHRSSQTAGILSGVGSAANAVMQTVVPGAASLNTARDFWMQGRYGWAAAYGTASVLEAVAAVLTFGGSQTLMIGTRTSVNMSRGLRRVGARGARANGSFSRTANAAGGEVFTSTGTINQNSFSGIVNSGMYKGTVDILSGVHGSATGAMTADFSLFAADVTKFGNLPGVTVATMTKSQIGNVLNKPGTVIGGFCDSGACLLK